jgi:CheY-like chemotaxis protein
MSERTFTSEKPLTAKGPAARTAYVVLVVDDELLERVLTATHLRKSGFDVIEAANGDEARRVLDSVDVNVVFVDLAMLGRTNGLALLRWLRERHPAIKAIVTSATETDMAGLDDDGIFLSSIFLSKPYRMVDLDFCLQKVLATARVPANETGGAMTADPNRKASPEPGKAQPDRASPNGPPAPDAPDGRDDEPSIAELRRRLDLSRQLAEREARQRAVDPAAAKAARRAALQAYERVRARRQRLVVGFAVGAIAASAIAYLVQTVGSPPVPPSPSAAALPEPASFASTAAATPSPAPPDSASPSSAPSSPSPATSIAYPPAVVPAAAQPEPAADSQPAPAPPGLAAPSPLPPAASLASAGPFPAVGTEPAAAMGSLEAPLEPAPAQTSLQRDEMREVQMRLRSFGFNPGPVDGAPGAMTESAVMHYQRNRGQPQTGKVDRDLLEQLRQDPAPQVAQRAPRPASRPVAGATTSPGPRPSDPFDPVRAAGDRLGRWLESLVR